MSCVFLELAQHMLLTSITWEYQLYWKACSDKFVIYCLLIIDTLFIEKSTKNRIYWNKFYLEPTVIPKCRATEAPIHIVFSKYSYLCYHYTIWYWMYCIPSFNFVFNVYCIYSVILIVFQTGLVLLLCSTVGLRNLASVSQLCCIVTASSVLSTVFT